MPLEVVRNDITKMYVDAIVNTASRSPNYYSGTDTAVYTAAGAEELLAERRRIGVIPVGSAAVTGSYRLRENDVKYIIHAVSPAWRGDYEHDCALLRSTYDSVLALAAERNCESLACPLLSAGNKNFPVDIAIDIAVEAFRTFLREHDMQIYLVLFGFLPTEYAKRLFHGIESFVDDDYVDAKHEMEYGACNIAVQNQPYRPGRRAECIRPLREERQFARCGVACEGSLKELFADVEVGPAPKPVPSDESFVHMLDRLMDTQGIKPGDIYNRSNVTKQMVSKLHCDENYTIRKENVLALAFILKLDLATARDFLSRADYAFNPASKRDAYLMECMEKGQYTPYKIDDGLFEKGLPCIFC